MFVCVGVYISVCTLCRLFLCACVCTCYEICDVQHLVTEKGILSAL